MVNILLIILITYVRSLQTAVHQQFPGITWNAARDVCKPFGLENSHDYLKASFIPDGQEFWIGKAIYKELTPWIEIFGCYQIWENLVNPFYSVESVGMCKHKCDTEHIGSYFGYRKKNQRNCVCQPKYITQDYRSRIDSCDSSANFFVYEEYYGIVNMASDPGHCTTICCGSCNKPTQNRNHLEGRRCSTEDNNIVGRCDVNDDPVRCFSGVFSLVNGQRILNVSDHMCSELKNWFICKTNSSATESITHSTLSTIYTSKEINISPSQSLTSAYKSLRTQGPINTKTITQSWLFTLEMSKGAHTRTSSEPLNTSSSHKTSPTARKTFRETDFRNYQKDNKDKSTSIG